MSSNECFEKIIADHRAAAEKVVVDAAKAMIDSLNEGGTIFICGNGGSAADSQHFAAELTGLFESRKRKALPGIALTVDTSALTSIANDMGFEYIFSRQLEGLARPGDVLVGITTSGRSKNVLAAMDKAHELGMRCIGLTGEDGSAIAAYGGPVVAIPAANTARVQEMHITVIHTWCSLIEKAFV